MGDYRLAGRRMMNVLMLGCAWSVLEAQAQDTADGGDARRTALAERFNALQQDARQQSEALGAVKSRLYSLTQELAPLVRVCVTARSVRSLAPNDSEDAEKRADAVESRLREASHAARACTAPDALKAAHRSLSEAIDETAVIERLVRNVSGGSDEVVTTQDKIPGGLAAIGEFTDFWETADAAYTSFGARVAAYQKDAEDFNAAQTDVKPPLAPVQAEAMTVDGALKESFASLSETARKIGDIREQLADCESSDTQGSAQLIERVTRARQVAARAFATYGEDITRDSSQCQTLLETKAKIGDAPVIAQITGNSSGDPSEPPPPQAAPVGPVTADSLPQIPGSKIKPSQAKPAAKRPAAARDGSIKVSGVSGFASTQEGSNTFGLSGGQTVAAGGAVETQPSSKVRLAGVAQTVDVGEASRVQLPSLPDNLLKLTTGTVELTRHGDSAADAHEPNFDGVETEQGSVTEASLAQERARYKVTAAQGQTSVEVFDGKVHLSGTYVLKVDASGAKDDKQAPAQETVLAAGERAILLNVGAPTDALVADGGSDLKDAFSDVNKAAAPAIAPAVPVVAAPTGPLTLPRAMTRMAQAEGASEETSARVKPKAPAALAKAAPESTPVSDQRLPKFFAGAHAAALPGASAEGNVDVSAVPATDPLVQARLQIERQRQKDDELRRAAEQQRAERVRIEQQRRIAEENVAAAQRADEQVSMVGSQTSPYQQMRPRIVPAFAGTWQCRVAPLQRARNAGAIMSQIIIRPTQRGFEAFAGGVRIPSTSIDGSRIRFAQVVASNDRGYYGALEFDLQDNGNVLLGNGRIRVLSGGYLDEIPATLSCGRSR